MQWVCVVKTRKKYIYYYLNDYHSTLRRRRNATTTQRRRNDGYRSARRTDSTSRTPQFPPHRCWRQGEPGGGVSGVRVGGELRVLLMVELGSPGFFQRRDVRACTLITPQKSMVHPPCKYLCKLIRGQGTRWCPQN
jgi:hypothetical protein